MSRPGTAIGVMIRRDKVWQSWYCSVCRGKFSLGSVRQSCLGTVSCDAVRIGEVRQSGPVREGLVMVRCVMFGRGGGEAVKAG